MCYISDNLIIDNIMNNYNIISLLIISNKNMCISILSDLQQFIFQLIKLGTNDLLNTNN